MEFKIEGFTNFMDLARYMIKQENRIKELERENYRLSKELLELRSVEEVTVYDGNRVEVSE